MVIPCHDEPDVLSTLADLKGCADCGRAVEVIVVFNASEADDESVRRRNAEALAAVEAWARRLPQGPRFRVHGISFPALPARHAGVGLARKLGMDEALARMLESGADNGIIVSLDADCRVDPDYLEAVARHFEAQPGSIACSIYFEHPLEDLSSDAQRRAIIDYELFLRYYRHGLRWAGHPCAHYTVGSCMAVRASTYAKQGGMNRRQAAEDFYFLNKLMLLGGFGEVTDTVVRPSSRPSRRVPFGTGRSVRKALAEPATPLKVCAPGVFDELRALFCRIDDLRRGPDAALKVQPRVMKEFLAGCGAREKLDEISRHTASADAYRSRFFRWFDGFRVYKFIRFAGRQAYGEVPVGDAAAQLLEQVFPEAAQGDRDAQRLLRCYRDLDRRRAASPAASVPQTAATGGRP